MDPFHFHLSVDAIQNKQQTQAHIHRNTYTHARKVAEKKKSNLDNPDKTSLKSKIKKKKIQNGRRDTHEQYLLLAK